MLCIYGKVVQFIRSKNYCISLFHQKIGASSIIFLWIYYGNRLDSYPLSSVKQYKVIQWITMNIARHDLIELQGKVSLGHRYLGRKSHYTLDYDE